MGRTSSLIESRKLGSICSEKKNEQKITVIHKVKCKCRCKGKKSEPAKTVQVEEYVDRPPCIHDFCVLERVKETCPEAAEMLKCPFPQAVPRFLPKKKPCDCCCKQKRKRRSKCMTREEFATMAEYAAKREAAVNSAQELVGFFNVMLLVADVIRERKAQKQAERKKGEEGGEDKKDKKNKKDKKPEKKEEKQEKNKPDEKNGKKEKPPEEEEAAPTGRRPSEAPEAQEQYELPLPEPEPSPDVSSEEAAPAEEPPADAPAEDSPPPADETPAAEEDQPT